MAMMRMPVNEEGECLSNDHWSIARRLPCGACIVVERDDDAEMPWKMMVSFPCRPPTNIG